MLMDRHENRLNKTQEIVGDFGWLVYLREVLGQVRAPPDFVQPRATNFRGLLQARNEIAIALDRLTDSDNLAPANPTWLPSLPTPVDRERICSRCSHLAVCGLFRHTDQ